MKWGNILSTAGLLTLAFGIPEARGQLFSDGFESGQKPEWTYHADSPGETATVEINEDRYFATPTHSLYIENLEGNYWGEDNGDAQANLDVSAMNLRIPYTIEFYFWASESTYYPYYNHFAILCADEDLCAFLYDDPNGISISDGDGWENVPVSFSFQEWVKVTYTRRSANSYSLQIGDWTRTGHPYGSSASEVSGTLVFGDYRIEFGKGAAYWDDLTITAAPVPIPVMSLGGTIIFVLLLLVALAVAAARTGRKARVEA